MSWHNHKLPVHLLSKAIYRISCYIHYSSHGEVHQRLFNALLQQHLSAKDLSLDDLSPVGTSRLRVDIKFYTFGPTTLAADTAIYQSW
jgi:hypothetical protein